MNVVWVLWHDVYPGLNLPAFIIAYFSSLSLANTCFSQGNTYIYSLCIGVFCTHGLYHECYWCLLILEIQAVTRATMWVLGTEFRSSVRATNAFNCWSISPDPMLGLFKNNFQCYEGHPWNISQSVSLESILRWANPEPSMGCPSRVRTHVFSSPLSTVCLASLLISHHLPAMCVCSQSGFGDSVVRSSFQSRIVTHIKYGPDLCYMKNKLGIIFCCCCFVFFFSMETGFPYVAWPSPTSKILLPLPPNYWD